MIQLIEIQDLKSDQVQMEFDPLEPWNHFYNFFKYFVPESMVHEIISLRYSKKLYLYLLELISMKWNSTI